MARNDRAYFKEYFKKQFEGLPPKAMAVIALRAATRVFLMFAQRRRATAEAFWFWPAEDRSRHAHAVCRCFQTAAFANSSMEAALLAAVALDDAPRAAQEAARAASDTAAGPVFAAYDAADAARAARYAAHGNLKDATRDALDALDAPTTADWLDRDTITDAILTDIAQVRRPSWTARLLRRADAEGDPVSLLAQPLWPKGMPDEFVRLWEQLQDDLRRLDAGFEVWIDWYQDRLDGKPFDWDIERQWALLSKEQMSQSPAEINAYLKALRDGALTKELRRVRAIFIGHGEAGKTSLIRALHGEDVIQGQEAMTQGIAIKDAAFSPNRMEKEAGVFTRITEYKDDDLTVHFWDFGGQVMAHATHQFFLRSQCLYVVVLAGRAERNPNEEAEYWLEHVRAFGDNAPVLIVGNKADVMPVNLDQTTLKQKFPNIAGFFSLSCTQAKGAFKHEFTLFRRRFEENLKALGENVQRFSPEQFKVLKTIEQSAAQDDFLNERRFDEICEANKIAMEGPGGRGSLLDLFDKLGIVMHFERLPYLTDYVLNPRWLTYGVYTIMYSKEAEAAGGRLSEAGLVGILKKANPSVSNGRALQYPADRCAIIAGAMVAFGVAYRLGTGEFGTGEFVIPALLAPEQPAHDFKRDGAIAFRFDFDGFLPRHVMPSLAVKHFQDIAKVGGREIVWQNGVLLRPRRQDAEAHVRADYHTRTIDILVKGTDAPLYLGMLRDSILATLETMPQLPFEEKVELRPDMRTATVGRARPDGSVWISYDIIQTAQKSSQPSIIGPDGIYAMDRVLKAMPVLSDLRQADVFLSYSSKDGAQIESLSDELEARHISVWYDSGLIAGQPYRDVLHQRIETAKAVVVLWTENSIRSKWVRAEADLADHHDKLICLRDPKLEPARIPLPFAANHHIVESGKLPELLEALALKGAKPRM
jgi:GTPase SAR1 family protein